MAEDRVCLDWLTGVAWFFLILVYSCSALEDLLGCRTFVFFTYHDTTNTILD